MNSINTLASLARERLIGGATDVDSVVAAIVDEAFESGLSIDERDLGSQLKKNLVGLGPLEELLLDPNIEEVWINSPSQIFVARNAVTEQVDLEISDLEIRQLVERMLRSSGRRLDRSEPFVDATLTDGSRLHVVIPEVTRKFWSVNIRKFPKRVLSLQQLVETKTLGPNLARYLESGFVEGKNILVSGATQAGKTTLLCAILDCGSNSQRLVSVEETFEIRTNYVDWVAMQARQPNLEGVGEITLRRLVREALRMRPTRLVIGEVRQAETLDLLIALNSGISGMCTIHANSAFEALRKLQLLPLLAGENIPSRFVEETVNQTIDIVVHCQLNKDGTRSVSQAIEARRGITETCWVGVNLD